MGKTRLDYSIFNKFNFERKPVGIKHSLKKPEGIEPLDGSLAVCEMFAEAQTSRPFYATEETTQCGELNLSISGLGYSMKARGVCPRVSLLSPFQVIFYQASSTI